MDRPQQGVSYNSGNPTAKRQIARYKQLYNAAKKKLDKQSREIDRLHKDISILEEYIDNIGKEH